jgi:molecular chaperone DnaJ
MYDLGGNPMGGGGAGGMGGYGFPGGAAGFDVGGLFDAMFGAQGSRGPRSRVRKGQDALVRLNLTLGEAAFGVTKPIRSTPPSCARPAPARGGRPAPSP